MFRLDLRHIRVIWSLLFALLVPSGCGNEQKKDALTAKEVVERMAKTYASCKTYSDSGVVKTLFIEAEGNRMAEKPFTTAFVRPDRFRFEYKHKSGNKEFRYIICRNGKGVQTWFDVMPGIKISESLGSALVGAVGVSSSSSCTVPGLLIPKEFGGRKLTDITAMKRIEDAKLDKVDCFRVQGKFASKPVTLWIDQGTFLLHRIDSKSKFSKFSTETTTTYNPVIDGEVTDKMLEFGPPDQN